MKEKLAIGIDIGGTNIKGVVINAKGEIQKKVKQKTEDEGDGWMNHARVVFNQLKEFAGSLPVGLSAPGMANEKANAIAFMPGRLEGLENLVWQDYFKIPSVKVLNDAHAALLAEAHFGAGKGISDLILLTLGTGVGGGILINGSVYKGFNGFAGHFGHISLDAESKNLGITNMPGSLEDAISESTVLDRSNGRYKTIRELVAAYSEGDAFATYVWLTSVRKLAIAICSFCNILAPHSVIIGGGIANADKQLFDPLKAYMDMYEWRPGGRKTNVVKAHFNEFTGAIGAAVFSVSSTQ